MNRKLFLSSSFADVATLLVNVEPNLKGKHVCFIPTASKNEKVVFYVQAARKAFEKLGVIINDLELSSASKTEVQIALSTCDMIYVSGGNTFYLLQQMIQTGADRCIIEAVNQGKLYIGESAGSIVAASNIEYIKAMDNSKEACNLETYEALALVDFYPIPHFNNQPFKQVAHKIENDYKATLHVMGISNHEVIIVHNNHISKQHVTNKVN